MIILHESYGSCRIKKAASDNLDAAITKIREKLGLEISLSFFKKLHQINLMQPILGLGNFFVFFKKLHQNKF